MSDLQVVDLYNNANGDKIDEFNNNIKSSLSVKIDYDKSECNYEWLPIMEETIRYIDNILRNPNRFIINEEDIVKVELARRITVDSIKHLSKNTNLIQDIDKKTGDVKPSKILNINKEESFNTYENRFVYSLIENMKNYIAFKKSSIVAGAAEMKDNKKLDYSASSKIGNEKYNISISLDSSLDNGESSNGEDSMESIMARVTKLENRITDLTSSEVYKTIKKLHVALVTSPIKKTNVILKNTNFQYALKLWNYMQEHMENDVKRVKDSKDDKIEGKVKEYVDETFMLDYLVLNTFNKGDSNSSKGKRKDLSEKLISNMLQKLIDLNAIDKEELTNMIEQCYSVIKYKNVVNDKEIYKGFRTSINNYVQFLKNTNIE